MGPARPIRAMAAASAGCRKATKAPMNGTKTGAQGRRPSRRTWTMCPSSWTRMSRSSTTASAQPPTETSDAAKRGAVTAVAAQPSHHGRGGCAPAATAFLAAGRGVGPVAVVASLRVSGAPPAGGRDARSG